MTTRWFTAKYVPDLRRREPRNVGVILVHNDVVTARFLGEVSGRVDGRYVRSAASLENYKAWVAHWRRCAAGGAVDRLLQHRNDDNYFVEIGGEMLTTDDRAPEDVLEDLYGVLVEPPPPETETVKELADAVLLRAGIATRVERDVRIVTGEDELQFDYKFLNGDAHLMKRVTLATPDERSWNYVHAAAWTFEKTAGMKDEADRAFRGLALVKGRPKDRDFDRQLGVLRDVAEVVDVREVETAASGISKALHLAT